MKGRTFVGAQVCKEGAELGDNWKSVNVFGSPAKMTTYLGET